MRVDPAQCGIAIRHAGYHHTQGPDIEDLVKAQRFAAHLFDDAVNVLGTPLHLRLDALRFQILREFVAQTLHVLLALSALLIQQAGDLAVSVRLQKPKGQVLHLPFDLPNAEAVGQGGEHMQRLVGQTVGHRQATGREVPQGLQARSQPQQHHPQVARKSQEHATHVLGMQARIGPRR